MVYSAPSNDNMTWGYLKDGQERLCGQATTVPSPQDIFQKVWLCERLENNRTSPLFTQCLVGMCQGKEAREGDVVIDLHGLDHDGAVSRT